MKRLIVLFVISQCFLISISQTSESTMDAIKENTHMTAEHTEKGSYEYVTLAISLFAFFIAIASLYYVVKTYRSQKQTERNTALWNLRDERRVLQKLCIHAIDSFAKLLTIERFIVTKSQYPTETLFHDMLFDVNSLHTSMYISDNDARDKLYELADCVNNLNQALNSTILYFVNHHDFISSEKGEVFEAYSIYDDAAYDFKFYSYFNKEKTNLYKIIGLTIELYTRLWDKRETKERKVAQNLNIREHFVNSNMRITNEYYSSLSLLQILNLYESVRYNDIDEYKNYHPTSSALPSKDDMILKCIGADVFVNKLYDDDITTADGLLEMYSVANGGTLYLKASSINEFKGLVSSSKEQKVLRPLDDFNANLLFDFNKNLLDKVCSQICNAIFDIYVDGVEESLKEESITIFNNLLKFRQAKRIVYSVRVQGFIYEAIFEVEEKKIDNMRTNIFSHITNSKQFKIPLHKETTSDTMFILDVKFKRGLQIMDLMLIDISSLFSKLISVNKYAV